MGILSNLKRKQGDATAEMTEQIDALGKMKSKIEKDKVLIMNEIDDARAATDEVMRAQASADMGNKKMLETLNAINKKVDDANLTLGDFASNKNKIACENSDLLRIVGDLDNNLNILAKQKAALAAQLNDVKALCDNEARERGLLLGKYRNLEHELDGAREALDEEAAGRENVLRLTAKAEGEAQCWRQKYETDAVAKGEELEMTKMKLTARLTEAEAAIDNLNAKLSQVEKAKGKIAAEISEMTSSLDQAQVLNAAMDRKAKQFDKVIGLALEHAIAGNAETQTTIKKYALQVRDAQVKVDDESASKSAAADAKVPADRRAAAVANGLEEARALLETADRQRRAAEQELADTNETLADLTNTNQSITVSKRKLEGELGQLNADLDEMTNEAKMSEDKAARAMVDAARLADELRCEQELAMNLEKDKKLLEAQCKDAATRADEAEVNALKGGRKAMIKMETRIRELESEMDAETRRYGDVTKNLRKSERSIKELTFAADEDRKNHERMQSLIDQLQGKVKSYKKQIEEAEEIAALNLAKYRKVAGALGDAHERADLNEQALAKVKAKAKSASLGL